ncbi:MAG: hypothetical protein IJX64_00880 [Clostridia bacterium]|nr:hypothetical protein [Clostridia bacterium]
MELYKDILTNLLCEEEVEVHFPNLKMDVEQMLNLSCYKALKAIKTILEDESLNDSECFLKIEEIICIFESLGSPCRGRHDFG